MSHSGWSSTQRITLGATVPSAVPLTIHARVLNTTLSGIQSAVSISDGSSANYFALRTSNKFAQASTTAASSASQASGATSLSTSTWYSLCARFSGIASRQIFVDGAQDGTSTGSRTPTGINTGRIATLGGTGNAWVGSLAEVAVWNVALSDADIAALAHVSPLLIRPDALISYVPLLDSGSLDLVAPAATVTGSLTKDNDHPRVILPRQRSLIIPKGAGGGGATAYTADLTAGSFALTGTSISVPTGRLVDLSPGSLALTGSNLTVPTGRLASLTPGSFALTGSDIDGVYVDNGAPVAYAADLDPGVFALTGSDVDAVATGQTTADTHDGIGYGDPYRRKRRPKKGKREKAVEDLLKKLMGLVPDDPPPAIEAEAEIAQASVERLFAPTVDVTPNLEALQFAQLQLAKLEAMLNRYLEDEDDEDDLLLMAA